MKIFYLVLVIWAICSTNLIAQSSPSDEEKAKLAQAAANPIASMISIPLQMNFNPGTGDYDRLQMSYVLEPVVPFKLNKKLNMVTRTIIPIVYQPDNAPSGGTFGLGNTTLSAFIVFPEVGKFVWGIGPAMNIPTASAPELGGDAFGIGPTLVALLMPGHWVVGITFNQIWSYKSNDLSSFFAQYFVTHNFKKGWYVNTTPTITGNFKASDGNVWTVPVGAGGGKIVHFPNTPVKFQLQAYYNALKPEGAADYSIVAQIVVLFPPHKKAKKQAAKAK